MTLAEAFTMEASSSLNNVLSELIRPTLGNILGQQSLEEVLHQCSDATAFWDQQGSACTVVISDFRGTVVAVYRFQTFNEARFITQRPNHGMRMEDRHGLCHRLVCSFKSLVPTSEKSCGVLKTWGNPQVTMGFGSKNDDFGRS